MRTLATVGCFLALLSSAPARTGTSDPPAVISTTLTAIREAPESYKNVWVSFPVQFSAVGNLQNPFFTRFVSSDYANFYVWADEQPIWRKEVYDDVFGLLFMSKDNDGLQEMINRHTYDRLQVTGIVRHTFQGAPWIEVTGFEVLPGRIDTATLSHLYRGEEHIMRRQWKMAISELSLATVATAPEPVQVAVHRNLAICHLRIGEPAIALDHLNSAVQFVGDGDLELQHLLQIAQADPAAGLDRAIDRQQVHDYDRPLWEAFQPARPAAPTPMAPAPAPHN
jgi:hypothetical protein